jgi:Uma2 family endonuclease
MSHAGEYVPTADERVVMHCVPWDHYQVQLALRGERSAPRISYLDGALEIMSPSRDHERIAPYISHLVMAYALERGIELTPYRSWTLQKVQEKGGLEPDECYIIGSNQDAAVPHLAIEVTWTSGGIDKLEIYRRLGVGEVWFWKDGRIDVYTLKGDRYERAERSGALPELDLQLVTSLLDQPTATQAVRALRDALRT